MELKNTEDQLVFTMGCTYSIEERINAASKKLAQLEVEHAGQWPREHSITVWRIKRVYRELCRLRKMRGQPP